MSIFSDRLTALRKEAGISQYEFARQLQMSRSTLSGYESEGKEPSFALLCKLAEFFDVSTDYLLGRSDERYNADIVFQKDSSNFKKHFSHLPVEEKAIVAETFDSFYVLLFRDVCSANKERLLLYAKLFNSLSTDRSGIKKLIEANGSKITDAEFLSSLMSLERDAKNNVASVLDKLLQSDLDTAIKQSGK